MQKKGVLILFCLFLLVLTSLSFVNSDQREIKKTAINQLRLLDEKTNKIQSQVFDEIEKQENIQVIVKLKENIQVNSGKLIDSYKNFEIREVSSNDLQTLQQEENIEKISLPRQIKADLQQSVPLINATVTWPLISNTINFTGQGETICIIDTGINFAHTDLLNKNKTCIIDCFNKACVENCSIADDKGHGTHVAGIIAANGSIKGVAPGASLIGLKVLDSAGNGNPASAEMDLSRAIDWCIINRNLYNISVISMSLGTDSLYSSYCDGSDLWTSSINNATHYNISVVAATANDGSTTSIAAPACIQNATAIGGSTKADAMYSSGNRNRLVDLIAPGVLINSTYNNGAYAIATGTSMSTPHVAGAIAVLKQALKLTGKSKTLRQIEIIFNNTGKIIYDSGSGLNYSRIDLYSAIISLDTNAPNVTLISPTSASTSFQVNQTFLCNISDDLQLKNITLYVWNVSSSLLYYNFSTISDKQTQYSINLSNLNYSSYLWNFYSCDLNNNCSYAQSNFSITISGVSSNLNSPTNATSTNQELRNFTCNSSSNSQNSLKNITLFIWNSTSSIRYSETKNITGTTNSTTFNLSLLSIGDGNYEWNCLAINNLSISAYSSSNFSITYDSTAPEISIQTPINNTWYNSLQFFLIVGGSADSCWFSLNNQANTTMIKDKEIYFNYYNISNQTTTSNKNNVTFYCNDSIGNINISSRIYFGIDLIEPNVTLISPSESYSETSSSTNLNFQFNTSDNINISQCKLIISGSSNSITANTSEITNSTNTIQQTISPGTYSWRINCTDVAGNEVNSSFRTMTISSPDTGSTGGGGGGGGTITQTYLPSEIQAQQGYIANLAKNEKIKLLISNQNHTITLTNILTNFINLTIQSSPIILSFYAGEEKRINLTNSDFYDLYIRLNSIANNKANITIKKINEEMPKNQGDVEGQISNQGNISNNPIKDGKEESILSKPTTIGLIILFSLILLIYLIRTINLYRLNKKIKNETKQKIKAKK